MKLRPIESEQMINDAEDDESAISTRKRMKPLIGMILGEG